MSPSARNGSSIRILALLAAVVCLAPSPSALALNAGQALDLTALGGWSGFELLSQGNDLTGISDAGYGDTATRGIYDGLGLYRDGDDLSVWVNHETSGAAISRVDLELPALRDAIDSVIGGGSAAGFQPVVGVGYAYETIFDGSYDAQTNADPVAVGAVEVAAYGNANFARFCSGTSHAAGTFGAGRGFVDSLYLTGEEVSGGKFYALDETTRTLWEAPDLGLGNWENAAEIDTGESDHVALLLMSDVGGGTGDFLQMYVGKKGVDANADGEVDFLERNGLRGGQVYYFDPEAGASSTDLPDGAVDGLWSTSSVGALRETKLEDAHANPFDGTELVFADQTDGLYRMDVDLVFDEEGFDAAASPVSIFQIDDDDVGPLGAPDNLTWSRDGNVYVQEDGSGDGVYRISPTGNNLEQLAAAGSEPSGVIDVSETIGYVPGSVLMLSLQGSGASGAQLGVLVSPDAAALEPGDYDLDGDVDQDDYAVWAAAFGTDPTQTLTFADGNGDGLVGAADYTVWRDAVGAGAGSIPEPTAVASLATLLTLAWTRRPRRRRTLATSC